MALLLAIMVKISLFTTVQFEVKADEGYLMAKVLSLLLLIAIKAFRLMMLLFLSR